MAEQRTSLGELARLFLRLGCTAFGGPLAHIAMMREEVVQRRRWLSEEHFLDLLSATNLIPGPNSTELAIHIGMQRRGLAGLLVAGASFILPSMLLTLACGWFYVRFGKLPAALWLLYGVRPVILAIVLAAIVGFARKALRTTALAVLGLVAAVLAGFGVNELLVLFGAATLALLRERLSHASPGKSGKSAAFALPAIVLGKSAQAITLPHLFWIFLKTGSVLFGSGYVLLAFLRADLVERLGWLSEPQLVDAIAVGQITPGPVFTTATFIGYLLLGTRGALAATVGIFSPAFVLVALSGVLVERLRSSKSARAFLDGLNAASLALMAVVTFTLGRSALIDVPTLLLAALAAFMLLRFKTNSSWLVLGGACAGLALHARALFGA